MTWVFGWPLYFEDAVEISQKHNLVKEPVVNEHAYIDAAQWWVACNAGFPLVFACWADDELHYVFALDVVSGNLCLSGTWVGTDITMDLGDLTTERHG
ncbi:uncharacterized protein B0H18DRAFT_1125590 [Fomitopsis serialis]|uniref:uncharacterized protein n=1 Tax=Fomitopsis serialis TaxID=139415 RepID=UPI002007C5A3|nr:uncharacterized protein B0H18DRAFT_1125590 [Neoantrodia serialis]KAH9914431.1 hypothetical protein B0H18DRAFT_1125590 [Neoantrodia serialis]